jgi:hypothetical protein
MNKPAKLAPDSNGDSAEMDRLYAEFVRRFYGKDDRELAKKIAVQLQAALAASPDLAQSIRGEEIRSLIAELHGEFERAIQNREAEIRKILELHSFAINTPSWDYVAKQYDFSDVSDRLDLLANLYHRHGDTHRAIAVLHESRQYCRSHGISFDGQEMLDDFEHPAKNGAAQRLRKRKSPTSKS